MLFRQNRDGVNLDLEVRSPQCGDLDLRAGGKGSGKAFHADLAGSGGFSEVRDKAGHLDDTAQGAAIFFQDNLELIEDSFGLSGDVTGCG